MKILNLSQREQIKVELEKADANLQLRSVRAGAPVSVNETNRTISFVLSDETQDHAGDIIRQAGWDLSIFKNNPVLPWCHMYDEPPLGNWQNVTVSKNQLVGMAKFASAEDYPFADTIFRLAARGFLRGVSVGFNPTRWNMMRDEQNGFLGYEFIEQSLLECSACTMPMNPNALARSFKDGVINKTELADVITRRILSELDLSKDLQAEVKPELLSRLEKTETEIETLKALLSEIPDADGKAATSHAAASDEVARILALIAEIKTLKK